jgi:predicted nuclease with TOPRIM domain
MLETLTALCQPYLWTIAVILMAVVILQAAGVGVGTLIKAAIAWLTRNRAKTEVNVNVGTAEARELIRHTEAVKQEVNEHNEKMGGLMPEKSEFLRLFEKQTEKDFARVDKRIDQLWDHHEKLEKDLFDRLEAIMRDYQDRDNKLKEALYSWKKEVLENQKLILAAISSLQK